mgnify:CR=1 FL=1
MVVTRPRTHVDLYRDGAEPIRVEGGTLAGREGAVDGDDQAAGDQLHPLASIGAAAGGTGGTGGAVRCGSATGASAASSDRRRLSMRWRT